MKSVVARGGTETASLTTPLAPAVRRQMRGRSIDEPHRGATQLELLFDLTIVIAVAATTQQFAHDVAEGSAVDGVMPFLQVFFFLVTLVTTAVAGLILLLALWWLYFLDRCGDGLAKRRDRSFRWGYGHDWIFASLAAVGAGLEAGVHPTSEGHTTVLLVASSVVVGSRCHDQGRDPGPTPMRTLCLRRDRALPKSLTPSGGST